MSDQERPFLRGLVPVMLGLMVVFYLAVVFLAGADFATGFERLLYVLIGAAVVFVVGFIALSLGGNNTRRIFILYDGQDADFVATLYDALKTAPFKILWDKTAIQVGDNIENKLKELFDSSSEIIFVVSQHSAAASWAGPALAQARKKHKRILPVLIDDAELPKLLQGIKPADFRLDFDDGYFALREALRARRQQPTPPAAAKGATEAAQTPESG